MHYKKIHNFCNIFAKFFLLTFLSTHFNTAYIMPEGKTYQDIFVNGQILAQGVKDCESRYQAIKQILDLYKRPFTSVDIGASEGYFSFRTASDYNAICIMIEGGYSNNSCYQPINKLLELCHKNSHLNNIILLGKFMQVDDLRLLAACEHFDIIFCFNILHHFGANAKSALEAILKLGDNIIIETPTPNDTASNRTTLELIISEIKKRNGIKIGTFERHTNKNAQGLMFWVKSHRKYLDRVFWTGHRCQENDFVIESSFTEKSFYKNSTKTLRPYIPGINLMTFKCLNGIYPTIDMLNSEFSKFKHTPHPELMLWNIILQGNSMCLIDCDEIRWTVDQKKAFEFTLEMLNKKTSAEVINYFNKDFRALQKTPYIKNNKYYRYPSI